MESLNEKEIQGLKDILDKYSEIITAEEVNKIENAIDVLEKSVINNVISNNIINLLAEILENALAKSLTKENVKALQKIYMEENND